MVTMPPTSPTTAAARAQTDETSNAQGRFTVAIPADVRPMIDDLAGVFGQTTVNGVAIVVPLTSAQVIVALVKGAHQTFAKSDAGAE